MKWFTRATHARVGVTKRFTVLQILQSATHTRVGVTFSRRRENLSFSIVPRAWV